MRKIKFRVWDKENNCWYQPVYEAYKGNLEHLLISLNGSLNIRTMTSLIHESGGFPDRFIMTQYTGLKDKNGKEIYEGDIVKYDCELYIINFGFWEPGNGDHIQSAYGYYLDPVNKEKRYYEYCPDETCEIIGNIHENPELLEAK